MAPIKANFSIFMKPIVLCFSGSDPSGGAGIQADIAAIHQQGAHCASVITALTVQNTQNVFSFLTTPAELIVQQANVIVEDMPINAVKLGMLGSVENVKAIAQWLTEHPHLPVILDPVIAANSGGELSEPEIVAAISQYLLPKATIATPNAIEAYQFATHALNFDECAKYFLQQQCEHVLIKGGHTASSTVTNVLYDQSGIIDSMKWPRLPHTYHGSGCTLAASIAAYIAKGCSILTAVQKAQHYTWECLANAYQPGKGQYIPERYSKE